MYERVRPSVFLSVYLSAVFCLDCIAKTFNRVVFKFYVVILHIRKILYQNIENCHNYQILKIHKDFMHFMCS